MIRCSYCKKSHANIKAMMMCDWDNRRESKRKYYEALQEVGNSAYHAINVKK